MKTIKFAGGLMMTVAMLLFAACDSDRDANPVLDDNNLPQTFKLNTPAYANSNISLANSSTLHFSWSQPAYGFPAKTTYVQQISLTNTWEPAEVDETGKETKAATFYQLDGSTTGKVSRDVDATDFAKGIVVLGKYEENTLPTTPLDVYVRCLANVEGGHGKVISNSVKIKVIPTYVDPINYPNIWYITGDANYGAGATWNTSYASNIPFDFDPDQSYDASWNGTYTKTFYVNKSTAEDVKSRFKIVKGIGDWSQAWGGTFAAPTLSSNAPNFNDVGDGVSPEETGWYKLTMKVEGGASKSLEIKKLDGDNIPDESKYPVHTSMKIEGSGAGDTPIEMQPMFNNGHNHVWYAEFTAVKGIIKIVDENGKKYCNNNYPYGWAHDEGAAIPVPKGKLALYFDDISGCYQFRSVK